MITNSLKIIQSSEVGQALRHSLPVVALESTVITHGLPAPQNLKLARDMEKQVRQHKATPATIGLLDGELHIGLNDPELERLAGEKDPLKVSRRDFATAVLKKACGGATVAGSMFAAQKAGIKVFATGGIGGVHKETPFDISTDLQALADTPMIVVCAGAKSILDLPATLEYLETMAVPVIGYKTDRFPAFYKQDSGLAVSLRLESAEEIAQLALTHWEMGMRSAILVAQPVPAEDAMAAEEIDPLIEQASQEAREMDIHGQALTPFLLGRIKDLSAGRSLQANLSLLLNNARLAAQIARVWSACRQRKSA
ncbi:MAG: pseudouridine-5'-phosphate glycosidase [Anaerolineales bacterium]|nr:pseudouridine-5'-phosphate glycosidase [Anaerolineales bacterium]